MLNHSEALKQQELLSYSIARNAVAPGEEQENENHFDNEDDLHEVQVDDDLKEPFSTN